MTPEPTTRAYTLKLTGEGDWRESLWKTHVTVNRGVQVWGDWLLTLRGGVPPSLADGFPERRVLLALSWLSVESPEGLVPQEYRVTSGGDSNDIREQKVLQAFDEILTRLRVENPEEWIEAAKPALTARIRDDAVWVNRSQAFSDLQSQFPGLSSEWGERTFFELIGSVEDYFAMPDSESAAPVESKDFVQKAGGWLSRNWGSGEKSDSASIAEKLTQLAGTDPQEIEGVSGIEGIVFLLSTLGVNSDPESGAAKLLKEIKQNIGWKGRPSKGAIALEKMSQLSRISGEDWDYTQRKLTEEAEDQSQKGGRGGEKSEWMKDWRESIEDRIGIPFRISRDLIWEFGVVLDHALRRVSAGHTWIKRAEVERKRFAEDALKLSSVPEDAQNWLDQFCEDRSQASNSTEGYRIRKRAIDGWEKVVDAWMGLTKQSEEERIQAARDVQANLDDNEKFGDIQLFETLACEDAVRVWKDASGLGNPDLLKSYVAAKSAEFDQSRFKVPAYRHPDPLRHPVYVDFGNSRWDISYSALKSAQNRTALEAKLPHAKTEKARLKILDELATPPELQSVTLGLWTGSDIEPIKIGWQSKRLWKDLDLKHFTQPDSGNGSPAKTTRADRLGRSSAGKSEGAVNVAGVFEQKDWNGRLQIPRQDLDRLADLCYGKGMDPDFERIERLRDFSGNSNPKSLGQWRRLNWFLSCSMKLTPSGPWLDYVEQGMPEGIEYRTPKGRTPYLHYEANKNRKSRARIKLSRLPGLRILSFDLGHRHAAACVVWQAISSAEMERETSQAEAVSQNSSDLFRHLHRTVMKRDRKGKEKPVQETKVYRRIASDLLPDGTNHPAPWARLERQFLIRLQGEETSPRRATQQEFEAYNSLRKFLGLEGRQPVEFLTEKGPQTQFPRIDDLQRDSVRLAQLGLRGFGDYSRVAYILTAKNKPLSGGILSPLLTHEQRIDYLQEGLLHWYRLAGSREYQDLWAKEMWSEWINEKLGADVRPEDPQDLTRPERRRRNEQIREQLKPTAEKLAGRDNGDLHELWSKQWKEKDRNWRIQLRKLRQFILPRIGKRPKNDPERLNLWKSKAKALRQVGGLSQRRLKTIRDLYQVLKAYRMRPEPGSLLKNVPQTGDISLAKFGRRILDQLERMREQRIKQLASRIIEAALGVGSENCKDRNGRKRPSLRVHQPCHVVVAENLERYRPEDSRLRRENRQLMDWSARNVRKLIMEGCQLYGLHFDEVQANFTSRQDSRTGAPGVRCEEVSVELIRRADRHSTAMVKPPDCDDQTWRMIEYWYRELGKIRSRPEKERTVRDRILLGLVERIDRLPAKMLTCFLPRRGGEFFYSASSESTSARGLQADLNAAANIGLKALLDPDWEGAWWFVLVDKNTGIPDPKNTAGAYPWQEQRVLLQASQGDGVEKGSKKKRGKTSNSEYGWNPLHLNSSGQNGNNEEFWHSMKNYWPTVEILVAEQLAKKLSVEK